MTFWGEICFPLKVPNFFKKSKKRKKKPRTLRSLCMLQNFVLVFLRKDKSAKKKKQKTGGKIIIISVYNVYQWTNVLVRVCLTWWEKNSNHVFFNASYKNIGFFKTTQRKKRLKVDILPVQSPASLVLNKRLITWLKLPENLQDRLCRIIAEKAQSVT